MGTNGTGCTEWERDFDEKTEQPVTVIPFKAQEYTATPFEANGFTASGTLCGHVDLALPHGKTYQLSPDEVRDLIMILRSAVDDVLQNSNPLTDPRIIDR